MTPVGMGAGSRWGGGGGVASPPCWVFRRRACISRRVSGRKTSAARARGTPPLLSLRDRLPRSRTRTRPQRASLPCAALLAKNSDLAGLREIVPLERGGGGPPPPARLL